MFFSPLEQFEIVTLFFFFLGSKFVFTNSSYFLVLAITITVLFFYFSCLNSTLVPNRWQSIVEMVFEFVQNMTFEALGSKGSKFFPFLFATFTFVFGCNILGMVPYTFTLTSHLIVTLALSLALFIGINIVCISLHSFNFFSLFFPSGSSVILGLLLVPIEVISYIFKPISLSVRLFANMMAGHTLLKVIVGFAWNLMACSGILFLISVFPLIILLPLFGLELGVALIQGFVFTILICIYLNDSINLH